MANKNNQIEYNKERETYIPHDTKLKDPVFKKLKQGRMMLFISSIVHLGACAVFLILLLVGLISGKELTILGLTKYQTILALSYVGISVLINILAFLLPARKAKKKNYFRIIAILTLILSTLILSGSFVFWGTPTLLFYSIITLITWVFQVISAIFLILVVEALPN